MVHYQFAIRLRSSRHFAPLPDPCVRSPPLPTLQLKHPDRTIFKASPVNAPAASLLTRIGAPPQRPRGRDHLPERPKARQPDSVNIGAVPTHLGSAGFRILEVSRTVAPIQWMAASKNLTTLFSYSDLAIVCALPCCFPGTSQRSLG